MNNNTIIGYGPEQIEQNRRSIKIWFRGTVTTIGKAENILLDEAVENIINEQGISREVKDHPIRFSDAWHISFKYFNDSEWCYNYLESINWDRWQRNNRYKK